MPYNGSGVFSRVYAWVTDASNSIPMTPSRFDQDANDMAAGLSNCVTRNGQSPATANLPMGNFKFTGLAAGTDPSDSVNFSQLSFTAAGTGGAPRTIQAKLSEQISAIDFGAIANGTADDLAAANAAAVASPYVFIPESKSLFTSGAVNYQQFYGAGTMRMGSSTINLPPYPKTGGLICGYNPLTFGSYENAVAGAFTINSANGQLKNNVQVNGTSGSGYATPVGQQRDHVALFFLAAPPTRIFCSTDATYTATTMTAAAIGAASATAILPGMIVDTLHATPYSGTVLSRSGSTITVDSWWLNGATPAAGTPSNATGAVINPTTVTFGSNGVVSTTSTGGDAATGIEIDVFAQNATGANASTAFDAVGLGTFTALAGVRTRGNWQIGSYAQGSGIAAGFVADTTVTGFEARNATGNGFQSRVSSIVKWAVNSLGNLSQDFRNTTINASATYSFTTSDVVVVNVSGGAVLTLPAVTGQAGRTITVNASAGCTVKNQAATTIKTLVGGTSAIFSCDGSFWY